MKTPIEELIEKLTNMSNSTYFNGKRTDCDIIDKINNIIRNEFLKKEKQIIKHAFIAGSWDTSGIQDEDEMFNNYYRDNFIDNV